MNEWHMRANGQGQAITADSQPFTDTLARSGSVRETVDGRSWGDGQAPNQIDIVRLIKRGRARGIMSSGTG